MSPSEVSGPSAGAAAFTPVLPTGSPRQAAAGLDLSWRVVALANIYRLLLPPMLFALQWATRQSPSVGAVNPDLFLLICAVYWVMAGLVAFGGRGHWPSRRALVL